MNTIINNTDPEMGENIYTTYTNDTMYINSLALSEPNDKSRFALLREQTSSAALTRSPQMPKASLLKRESGSVKAEVPAESESNYLQEHWDNFYSKITKNNFFYIRATLFDNGEQPRRTRYKLSISYITQKGSKDWQTFTIPFPKRQRDVSYNLQELAPGVSGWTHEFYQNLRNYRDDLYASKFGNEWLLSPRIGKAHEAKSKAGGKQPMGPVIPFIGACLAVSNKAVTIKLNIGAVSFDINMKHDDPNAIGNKIAVGEWMDMERTQTGARIGRLKL